MDVQREFAAALRRVNGEAYKGVLQARARIWRPTPIEQADIDAGRGEHPQQRRMRKVGEAMKGAAEGLAAAFAPLTAMFNRATVDVASRRQKALNDLSAMLPTDELERLVRIAQRGTPLWQLEQFSAVITHPVGGRSSKGDHASNR